VPDWVDDLLNAQPSRGSPAPKDGPALLAAIYADPADTSRRLVYADFLAERGDPRGEFISLQCNRAPDAKPSKRERELLKNYGREWLGALDSGLRKQGVLYRRGFPAEGRECANDEQLKSPAWATFEAIELDASTWGKRAVSFLDRPELDAVERLYLDAELASLLKRPKPKVHTLGLRRATAEHVEAVLSGKTFPALRQLDLDQNGTGFAAVVRNPRWKQLERVRLTFWSLRELPAFRGVRPSLEVVDGHGLSDDRNGWCLQFSGPRLERLHLSCTDKKPNMHWVWQVLFSIQEPCLVEVTADQPEWLSDSRIAQQLTRLRS
jgi:uncharacterized protein (TIGR02996 family)